MIMFIKYIVKRDKERLPSCNFFSRPFSLSGLNETDFVPFREPPSPLPFACGSLMMKNVRELCKGEP